MLKAADIMTKDVAMIRGSATVAEAILLMQERGWRALVVDRAHDQDAYGMITEADIVYQVVAPGKNPHKIRVYEIMAKPCIVVNPDLGVDYVAKLFADHGLLRAPVIQNQLLGIITVSDILLKGQVLEAAQPILPNTDLQQAIAQAQRLCITQGATSPECLAAWDQVDRLQVEAAHRRGESLEKTAFEAFCENYPEVTPSQVYDTWCSG